MSSQSSPTPQNNSPSNKRRHSEQLSSEDEEDDQQFNKRQQFDTPSVPPVVALPPPLMQYPNGQFVPIAHPHQQATPPAAFYYYPISPQQHPYINPTEKKSSTTQRILPKLPENQSPTLYPQTPIPSPYFHPYTSPTLIPTPYTIQHQQSTADQREKARKMSHSAIERRRRERINDKIIQLRQLIPSCADQDNLHKMTILQSAIDYIAFLKDVVNKLDNNEEILKGEQIKLKVTKSMLPKEIEPFTTQFSISKSLKPMDVIQPGVPLSTSPGTIPLTPPQEPNKSPKSKLTDDANHMSIQNMLC